MDIFEDLGISKILKEKHEWIYEPYFKRSQYHPRYERLYYYIDDEHIIEVSFQKEKQGELIIRMVEVFPGIPQYNIIFSKKITKYWKYFFLFLKLHNIRSEFKYDSIKENEKIVLAEKKRLEEKKERKKMADYEESMSKIPKSFLRESVIDKILED
tara:strand:+ start:9341 stop:9808 length:468 start_codon:yes stop_codon:yes gene_type:complete